MTLIKMIFAIVAQLCFQLPHGKTTEELSAISVKRKKRITFHWQNNIFNLFLCYFVLSFASSAVIHFPF